MPIHNATRFVNNFKSTAAATKPNQTKQNQSNDGMQAVMEIGFTIAGYTNIVCIDGLRARSHIAKF